jgi:6,7-dimethyl-8-ribityllumazine synthase
VDALESDVRRTLKEARVEDKRIQTITVPGCFEIPFMCKHLFECEPRPHGIIALGLVIEGETHHARLVTESCTDAIQSLQIQYGIPIIHGVLFVKNRAQGEDRTRGPKARGKELAEALLAMIDLLRRDNH